MSFFLQNLDISQLKNCIFQQDSSNVVTFYVPQIKPFSFITEYEDGTRNRKFLTKQKNEAKGLIFLESSKVEHRFTRECKNYKIDAHGFKEGIEEAKRNVAYQSLQTSYFKISFNLHTGFYDFIPLMPTGFSYEETAFFYFLNFTSFVGFSENNNLALDEELFQAVATGQLI